VVGAVVGATVVTVGAVVDETVVTVGAVVVGAEVVGLAVGQTLPGPEPRLVPVTPPL
jgi:hypothetical protein